MTPMQRDDTCEDEGRADRGRVHERCLCTSRISIRDVQNNNKDTLYEEFYAAPLPFFFLCPGNHEC